MLGRRFKQVIVRGDSAFAKQAIFDACEEAGHFFAVVSPQQRNFASLFEALPGEQWKPYRQREETPECQGKKRKRGPNRRRERALSLTGRAERIFHAAVGRGPISGIVSGTIVTILVQSSSTTTSLIIPMAGSGVMRLKQIFPFTLGANIGTTITALIASLSGGDYAEAALQIALVHLLFNIFATVLIYGIPILRAIPLNSAEWLAGMAIRKRSLTIVYVLAL